MDYKCQEGQFNMDYKVLVGESADMLSEIVNMHINIGYKPIGGASVSRNDYGKRTFSQAVIKGD